LAAHNLRRIAVIIARLSKIYKQYLLPALLFGYFAQSGLYFVVFAHERRKYWGFLGQNPILLFSDVYSILIQRKIQQGGKPL